MTLNVFRKGQAQHNAADGGVLCGSGWSVVTRPIYGSQLPRIKAQILRSSVCSFKAFPHPSLHHWGYFRPCCRPTMHLCCPVNVGGEERDPGLGYVGSLLKEAHHKGIEPPAPAIHAHKPHLMVLLRSSNGKTSTGIKTVRAPQVSLAPLCTSGL